MNLLKKYIRYANKIRSKNKKGGANILLEFVFLLPFFFVIVLLVIDCMRFYYLWNVTNTAAYSSSYAFSMSGSMSRAMESGQQAYETGFVTKEKFKSDRIKASYYIYGKDCKCQQNIKTVNANKQSWQQISGLTTSYNNNHMLNRTIVGFEYRTKIDLMSGVLFSNLTAGVVPVMSIDAVSRNHVFEMQYFKK